MALKMEDNSANEANGSKKRARVDSVVCDSDTPETKRVRVESDSDGSRVDSGASGFDSSEEGLMRNDILEILDDPDVPTDRDPDISDLDSVIRSFEEEILYPADVPAPVYSQPDLGYLLEASDDELGLPPAISPATENETKREVPCYESFGYEDELPSFEPLGFGFGVECGGENQFVNVGGLFDYSEEPSEFSDFLWRPETESLPAV